MCYCLNIELKLYLLVYSLCGYSNPISFKTVDENDILNVELFLRDKGQKLVSNNECKLLSGNDALSSSDKMIDIFGELYAENPGEFQFMEGDKIFIREIVKHVKQLVDGDGPLTGLEQFRPKKKKRINCDPTSTIALNVEVNDRESDTQMNSQLSESQIETLKTELMRNACSLFSSYDIDVNKWSIQLVNVEVTPKGIYGYINCVLCFEESKQMPEPRRVYYKQSTTRSSYWVLANFHKHMRTVHSSIKQKVLKTKKTCSKATKPKLKRKIKSEFNPDEVESKHKSVECNMIKLECNSDAIVSEIESVEHQMIKSECDSVEIKSEDKSVEFIHNMDSECDIDAGEDSIADKYNFSVEYVPVEKTSDDSELWLFQQISDQINQTVCASIVSSDIQDTMQFTLKQQSKRLTLIKIKDDGNCLFSAITHQLWPGSTTDKTHIKKTKQLRSDVVEHILKPDNFSMYEIAVQETMGSTNNLDVADATIKSKLWVRNKLSRSGKWGGLETIKAVSNMYRVNVVIFNEDSACYMIKGSDAEFERTILLAYRLGIGTDGEAVYNHYDSVCDMDSDTMLTAADFIINK